ncbi:threonine--tRNA ligase [Deltaproteobacteria bacterium]|nr:threonine--tRNA ligase [Deltaproteobacteria bacterium]
MNIIIDGKSVDMPQGASIADACKAALSGKKEKTVIAGKVGERILDLSSPAPESQEISAITPDSPEGLALLRHSAAHIMAAAARRLFPKVKVSIGPAIDSGFYYDFEKDKPFTPEDFPAIEAEMKKIAAAGLPFVREEMSRADAARFFRDKGEHYKVAIIEDLPAEIERVSLYTIGDFTDLCRGPHLPHTGFATAFTLLSVAGAYWRGDEKNKMLSRIYATAFASGKELDAYLRQIEEAKKRDHRKLGKELDLFTFHEDVAPGMAFWLPKGMLLRTILEDFLRKEQLKRGYQLVQGPQILRRSVWEKSGHYDNYRENMYFCEIDGETHGVKPMNCIGHMLLYGQHLHSYRDLPCRFFELGVVHRHEKSGVMHGLLRVRQFTQDDAHIICRPDQLEDEVLGVLDWVKDLFRLFGFSYKLAISTRPAKSIGSDEDWDKATRSLVGALDRVGVPYAVNEGDGAFYGPKIDVKVLDSLQREWQCSTIQVDFTLPDRFDLVYIGEDGERHRPVMIHRAIVGSLERFIGILTEHCAGAFPTWIAPVQARIITVTDAHNAFALDAEKILKAAGIRVETDARNEKLGYKVRAAQMDKIAYILVVGDKEVEEKGVNVRLRGGDSLGLLSLEDLAKRILDDCDQPFRQEGMRYRFS